MRPNVNPNSPESEDYKISFEEYKMLLAWTNNLADRRQETNNLFFGVSGAIVTVVSLALTQLKGTDRVWGLIFSSIIGIVVSVTWGSLLQRYREILRFKYAQLELFEEALGLDTCGLVLAEDNFFGSGKPLAVPGIREPKLPAPSKTGRFGITLAERNLPLVFLGIFVITLLATLIDYLF